MNTITVKGFEYEIGELYANEAGRTGYLSHHSECVYNGGFILLCCPNDEDESFIAYELNQIELVGEITEAPVKLIDGGFYKFTYKKNPYFQGWLVGEYCNEVLLVGDVAYSLADCADIKLMKQT